jgi:tetratricopeptide (TPR) repeat protein
MRHRLEQAYELRGDYRGLADMLALAAKGEPDPVNRVIILRQAATIQRELLSDAAASAAILEQAHAALPDDADLALDLASTLASAGQLSRAMTLVSALLDRVDLDDNARLGLLSTRADLRAATKDVAGTVEDLEVAVTLDPAAIAPRLAEALERQRSAAAAAEDAEAERAATLRLCEVSLLQSDRERVREVLGAWVERQRKDVEALRMLRDVDAADERWESVARTCGRLVAVESDEAQVEAALQLAHACRELGKPGDARPGLEHARRKQPDDPEILQALRHIYEETGADRELAKLLVADAEQASDPDERLVLLRRVADLFIKEGDIESALPIVTQVLELVPGDPAATVSLADVHLALGHTDEADAILDAAIADSKSRRSPELAMLYHRKAQVCAAAGDPHNQLAVLQQAFAVDKNNGQVAADLADLAEALEQWDLAVRVLRTITLIDADCPISRVQAFLRQAQIALRRGDRQRAVLWARKARHEGPDDTDVVAFLASLGE